MRVGLTDLGRIGAFHAQHPHLNRCGSRADLGHLAATLSLHQHRLIRMDEIRKKEFPA
jgi:hypothetical protein